MKLRDIIDPLLALLQDTKTAEELVSQTPTQFAKRAYIRSSFAYIEGTVWILKQACVGSAESADRPIFSPAEFALLNDESYDLKNNGETSVQTKFLRLPDNVKFTDKAIAKFFGSKAQIDGSSEGWGKFLKAIKIRNRITHPKSIHDYEVTDKEIDICLNATHWFNDVVNEQISAIQTTSRRAIQHHTGSTTMVKNAKIEP
jgi:hypothetical protein